MAEALKAYLKNLQAKGVSHLSLDEDSKKHLRTFYRQRNHPQQTESLPPVEVLPLPPSHSPSAPPSAMAAPSSSPSAAPQKAKSPSPLPLTITGDTPDQKIAAIKQQALEARLYEHASVQLREKLCFSTGNTSADIMIIGEAPGHQEELQSEPLVGPAGQMLDRILKAMGIERTEVYLSNICKHRPAIPKQTMNNRKPSQAEVDLCLPYLKAEIEVIKPKCLLLLGETVAQSFLGEEFSLSSSPEQWLDYDGIPLRVSSHPSELLRTQHANQTKRKVWEDMLAIMELLQMPITSKQRGYFQ